MFAGGDFKRARHSHLQSLSANPALDGQHAFGQILRAGFQDPAFCGRPPGYSSPKVNLAKNPKKNKFSDFNSWLLKTLHGVAPNLLVNTASAGMRLLMKLKDAPVTEGNILVPSKDPHEVYGETILPVASKSGKVVLGVGLAFVAMLVVSRVSGRD